MCPLLVPQMLLKFHQHALIFLCEADDLVLLYFTLHSTMFPPPSLTLVLET